MSDDLKVKEDSSDAPTVEASQDQQKEPAASPEQQKKTVTAKSSNQKMIIIVLVVLALIGGGIYLKNQDDKKRSQKTAENLIESLTGNKVKVDSDKQSFEVKDDKTGESVSIGTDQKLPSDCPKDSIVYLDEKSVVSVLTTKSEGKKRWSVTTTVDKSVEDAAAFFEGKIVEPEYTSINSYGYNESKSFSAKSAKYSLFITISKYKTDSDTSVTYVVEEE